MKNFPSFNFEVIKNDEDLISRFKQLFLDYTNWNPLIQMIDRTRNHEVCLLACDNFETILISNSNQLTKSEFQEIDQKIIELRLNCLDKTDRWNKYVEYFDFVLKNKHYYSTYTIESDIERFGKFYICSTSKNHHIHFLYLNSHRYEVIKRKIAKSLNSDKLGNLHHHKQSELSDEEIENRYNEVIKWSKLLKNME